MTNPVITTVTKLDNYKEGAINVLLPLGGIVAAGTLNKLTANVELIQSNKTIYNGIMAALSFALQFLPKSMLPEWAKKGLTGVGIYSALALLGDLAASPKVPDFVKKAISDYVPGLSGINGLRGIGSVSGGSLDDLIAAQTAASNSSYTATDANLATQGSPETNLGGFTSFLN